MRPATLEGIAFDVGDIDTLSPGSVLELARKVGLLLHEEAGFPELVRARLKRNYYET